MPPRLPLVATLIAATLTLAACGGSSKASTNDPTTSTLSPQVAAFYKLTGPVPNDPPGTVIRAVPVDAPAGAQGWRVLYVSRSTSGKPVATSGLVYAPKGTGPAGGRPVITWAHETTGIADDCSPSHQDKPTLGDRDLSALLGAGYVVAATDYEGLGTNGVHPYLVGASEAHSVLDAARAAVNIEDTGAGKRIGIYGYSQGGHATLFAAQEAAKYAPELTVVGSAAIAPPADLSQVGVQLATNRQLYGFGVLAAFGLNAAYPAQVPLDKILSPELVRLADEIDNTCSAFAFFALATQPFNRVFNPAVVSDPVVNGLLAENSAGANAPEGPVLIMNGGQDVLATPAMVETYVTKVCALGGQVEVITKPDRDHGGIERNNLETVLPWFAARFAGTPLPPGCPIRG